MFLGINKYIIIAIISLFINSPLVFSNEVLSGLDNEENLTTLNEELRSLNTENNNQNTDIEEINTSIVELQDSIKYVKSAHSETTSHVTKSTENIAAYDNSIPQYSEGYIITSTSITPSDSNNTLYFFAQGNVTGSVAGDNVVLHIHQGTTADAITGCVSGEYSTNGSSALMTIPIMCKMQAGTTSSITFNLLVSHSDNNTMNINGASGAAKYGGSLASSLTIIEVES